RPRALAAPRAPGPPAAPAGFAGCDHRDARAGLGFARPAWRPGAARPPPTSPPGSPLPTPAAGHRPGRTPLAATAPLRRYSRQPSSVSSIRSPRKPLDRSGRWLCQFTEGTLHTLAMPLSRVAAHALSSSLRLLLVAHD